MVEGTKHVEFADVEVLDYVGPVMCCRVGDRVVRVPALPVLPGTEIKKKGDRGRLVLPLDLVVDRGLAGRSTRSFSEDQPPASSHEVRIVEGVEDGAHAHRWTLPGDRRWGERHTVSNDFVAGSPPCPAGSSATTAPPPQQRPACAGRWRSWTSTMDPRPRNCGDGAREF
jgi:hypothetical protein